MVEIKNMTGWQTGILALEQQVSLRTDAAFNEGTHSIVYWISAIGPH